jgi:Cof subfamily protein (haloacid dehalogenase superfamily)
MSRRASKLRPDIRLIAIDLDGTLLDDRKRISPAAAKSLHEVSQRGIKVVIASARPPRSVRHVHAALRLDTWTINYNGALIWDEMARKPVFHRPLPGPIVRQIIEHARRVHPEVHVSCELLDRWYTDRGDQPFRTETGRLFPPDVIAPLEKFFDVSMTKILLGGEPALMNDIDLSLNMAHGSEVCLIRTEPDLIQIMHKRAGKAVALKMVAEHYKVPMKNVLAIGDAPNDLDMLRAAGTSVAMDNGHPAVKQIADWIAPSNNDHGVHAALVRYGLCE